MREQKEDILKHIDDQKRGGGKVGAILMRLGVKRSTYYSWKKPRVKQRATVKKSHVTPEEKKAIEITKEKHPFQRHRQIQGLLQNQGFYVSPSLVYEHLKSIGKVEPYARRPSPWDRARYSICRKHVMWGTDWSRLKINHVRWYLLVLIDFFSRLVVAFDIVPSVNAGHIRRLYQNGLKAEGISLKSPLLPTLRADRGSPNTAYVTRDFFDTIGADLSFARVRRPTDNAFTERFFGTIKQEEIYLVGNYPDQISAYEEVGGYVKYYDNDRPHQSLWNFTPRHIHAVNNKSLILEELRTLKIQARQRRKDYWENHTNRLTPDSSQQNLPVLSI